jgi:dethiobiotin synthetase
MRPRLVVEMSGTGTEVGKTFIAAGLLRGLADQRLSVAARKPVQSYSPGETTDSELLAQATGESPETVCPAHRSYPVAMAPPMAAHVLGLAPPTLEDLTGEINASWPDAPIDVGLVEGAGGVASPLAEDGDSASLAFLLPADIVVLVADPTLGVINLVRLCARALQPRPVIVHLNRMEPDNSLHVLNRNWLVERERLTVTTSLVGLIDEIVSRLSAKGMPAR